MTVLKSKQLILSRKKTKIGKLESRFHFLGINYLGTQTSNSSTKPKAVDESNTLQQPNTLTLVPHPRTLRKAREQVKTMVNDGISFQKISNYLTHWATWWAQASGIWSTQELLLAYVTQCWDQTAALLACGLIPYSTHDANYWFLDSIE